MNTLDLYWKHFLDKYVRTEMDPKVIKRFNEVFYSGAMAVVAIISQSSNKEKTIENVSNELLKWQQLKKDTKGFDSNKL